MKWIKNWLAKRAIRKVLRKTLGTEAGDKTMDWLKTLKLTGHKEKIAGLVGGLMLILASFGVGPEWMDWLTQVKTAVLSGNWQAQLAAFVAGVMLAMRSFRRMAEDRKDPANDG